MKKNWLAYILFIGLLLKSGLIYGQQQPVYSQYTIDKFLVNPAVAGANRITTVNFVSRQQYVGFENAPRTFALNAQSRLLEDSYILRMMKLRKNGPKKSRSGKVGLGASIYNDRNGIVSRTGFQATYAYHIQFSNYWQLSGGLSFHGYQFKIDDVGVPYADIGDPLLEAGRKTFFVPDASVGIFATNGSLFGGITMTDLLGARLKFGNDFYSSYKTIRKYNLLSGYKFELNSNFDLEPSLLLQGTRTNFSMDINTILYFQKEYWGGLSYRSNNTMAIMLGGRFDMFYLGYAYDLNLGKVSTVSSGSHEVVFGLKIGANNARRFRWIKQDEKSFDI